MSYSREKFPFKPRASATALCILLLTAASVRSEVSFTQSDTLVASPSVSAVTVEDFDGDGALDVAWAGVGVYLGSGTGQFAFHEVLAAGHEAVSGDFNGDGRPDIAMTTGSQPTLALSVFLGDGSGSFGAPTDIAIGDFAAHLVAANLDGNTRTDLVLTTNQGVALGSNGDHVTVLIAEQIGGFSVTHHPLIQPGRIAVGDLNGDTVPDIGVVTNGQVAVLIGAGGGAFAGPDNHAAGPGPRSVAIGDVSSDGKTDLVVANETNPPPLFPPSGGITVLLGDGTGGFGSPTTSSVPAFAGRVLLADITADGNSDFVLTTFMNGGRGDNVVYALPGDGAGNVGTPVTVHIGGEQSGIAEPDVRIARVNHGSTPDLVILDEHPTIFAGKRVVILLNGASDSDGDAVEDAADNCPSIPNPNQTDTDTDGEGNACDPDDDNDGVLDEDDAFPSDPTEVQDSDGDGIGDNSDPDDDNDGMSDVFETANGLDPLNPADASEDLDGDGFTNLQEFKAGTDPNDPASNPATVILPILQILVVELSPPKKTVFVTSTTHSGDLGGLGGGDAICQAHAVAAGLTGTYMAWLSSGVDSPGTRFTRATVPYTRVDTVPIADNWADLIDGSLSAPLNINEFGILEVGNAWTNTTAFGLPATPSLHCGSWTTMAGSGQGGILFHSAGGWTFASGAIFTCTAFHHLYCFEQ